MNKIKSVKDLKTIIKKRSNVIIYGAGKVGTALARWLLLVEPELSFFIAITAGGREDYKLFEKQVFVLRILSILPMSQ